MRIEVVFVGPPEAGAVALAGHADPVIAEAVFVPHEAAVPGRIAGHLRSALVIDAESAAAAFGLWRECDENGVVFAAEAEFAALKLDAGELHVFKEVYLEDGEILDGAIGNVHLPGDGFGFGVHPDVEVIKSDVVASAFGAEHAAEGVGTVEGVRFVKIVLSAGAEH